MDNLALLRDIHLPDEFSDFPSGYIWFIVLALGLVALAVKFFYQWFYLKSKKLYALNFIKNSEENSLKEAQNISQILRRICLLKYKQAASLFGKEWVSFLNAHSRQKIGGSSAELLIYAPYVQNASKYSEDDFQTLKNFAVRWIGENL